MATIAGFSPDDINRLYTLLQRVRDQEFNYRTRPDFSVDSVTNDPSSAPEVYVVKTPPEGIGYATIEFADTGTGTGTSTGTEETIIPGYAECSFLTFYEEPFVDPKFRRIDGLTKIVYNLGTEEIDGDTWILAIRIKSGQYIAINIFPPDTGTESFDTDCHLRIDTSNKIFFNVPTLAGPGLETTSTGTGTGTCWTLGIDTDCNLYIDADNHLQLDVESLAGDGLEAIYDTGTGTGTECPYLALRYGCHFYIDSQGRLQLNVTALAGDNLTTGTGSCVDLNFAPIEYGCGLYIDELGRVAVDLASLLGNYLQAGTGSCPVANVVIPVGCGLAYDILSGAIYVDFDDVVGTGLAWNACRLRVLYGCHLSVNDDGELVADVDSLAGDNTETALKRFDASECSPLSFDYDVNEAFTEQQVVLLDSRLLQIGRNLTQVNIYALNEYRYNAAGVLIDWEELSTSVVIREVDICDVECTGTGTGTSACAYFCFFYEVPTFPEPTVYGPLCSCLTEEQVTELENDGAFFLGGPFDTREECEAFCPETGTAGQCETQADCGTELFVGVAQNGNTVADTCTEYSIVIPANATYKITATHTSGTSDVELRWLSACNSGLTLGVEDFSGTTACINLGAQAACTVLYFCVTRTGGSGVQGFTLLIQEGTC